MCPSTWASTSRRKGNRHRISYTVSLPLRCTGPNRTEASSSGFAFSFHFAHHKQRCGDGAPKRAHRPAVGVVIAAVMPHRLVDATYPVSPEGIPFPFPWFAFFPQEPVPDDSVRFYRSSASKPKATARLKDRRATVDTQKLGSKRNGWFIRIYFCRLLGL